MALLMSLTKSKNLNKRAEDGYWSDEEKRSCNGAAIGVSSLCNIGSFDDIAKAAGLPPEDKPGLCDENLEKELGAANYVAMVPSGQIFDRGRGELPTVVGFWPMPTCSISNIVCLSLEKRQLYIFRVGSDQMIKGLGEGILSMKVGGKRRLYIPGPLAFPKGLTSAPGIHIPGLEVE
ncbi:peptidyl-prolyl cis-trans isomerase FKBP16 [Salix suchowensis]|nr:peptidyl-prolyl cis-trans isomerase FKBP16 [Salix suchowensis]